MRPAPRALALTWLSGLLVGAATRALPVYRVVLAEAADDAAFAAWCGANQVQSLAYITKCATAHGRDSVNFWIKFAWQLLTELPYCGPLPCELFTTGVVLWIYPPIMVYLAVTVVMESLKVVHLRRRSREAAES